MADGTPTEDSNPVDKTLDTTVEPVLQSAKGAVDAMKETARNAKDKVTGAEAAQKTPVDQVKGGVKKGIGAVMKGLAAPIAPIVRSAKAMGHGVEAAKKTGESVSAVVDGDVDKVYEKKAEAQDALKQAGKEVIRAIPAVHAVETSFQSLDAARDVVRGTWRYVFGDKNKAVDSGWHAGSTELGQGDYIHRRPTGIVYQNQYGEDITVDEVVEVSKKAA